MGSPRRGKDAVYLLIKSAKRFIHMLSYLISEFRRQRHLTETRSPHADNCHLGVYSAGSRQRVSHVIISQTILIGN